MCVCERERERERREIEKRKIYKRDRENNACITDQDQRSILQEWLGPGLETV